MTTPILSRFVRDTAMIERSFAAALITRRTREFQMAHPAPEPVAASPAPVSAPAPAQIINVHVTMPPNANAGKKVTFEKNAAGDTVAKIEPADELQPA